MKYSGVAILAVGWIAGFWAWEDDVLSFAQMLIIACAPPFVAGAWEFISVLIQERGEYKRFLVKQLLSREVEEEEGDIDGDE